MSTEQRFDAVVVGAGFAGLYMLHRLRGLGLSVRVFEAGAGIGGTWYWNRYPGARCDIQSMEYSYQFSPELQQEWHWTERYAPQAEILAYIEHVADRFDLRRDIQLETRVTSAHFDEGGATWQIETDRGDRVRARFCIMATGCLSCRNVPDFPGLESFRGECHHTGSWPHEEVSFRGKRVAVIGTGSSGIQSIPIIAEQAERLYVFQRTPTYSVPAHNAPLDPPLERRIKSRYAEFRAHNAENLLGLGGEIKGESAIATDPAERLAIYEASWREGGLTFLLSFGDLIYDHESNETAAEFLRGKIREIVRDPKTAELLCPDTTVGCKRLCVDTSYFATFNRPNVELVDVSRTPIGAITERGVRVGEREYEVDMLVLATGFDAMTGALDRIDIRGRGDVPLKTKWAEGPKTYLGLGTAGFPNLFVITGPGSPSVLSNMLPAIEQHVDWIGDCIGYLEANGLRSIEATPQAEAAWGEHVNEEAAATLFTSGCNSWYLGANVPGKPRVFMPYIGGFPTYLETCAKVASSGYEGFELR